MSEETAAALSIDLRDIVQEYPARAGSGVLRVVDDVVRPGDAVLVKASRAVGLEAVAEALLKVPAA